jgi:hypothetical protein
MPGPGRLEAVEVLALDVFGRADGKLITRRIVEERFAELGAHSHGCHCRLCTLVPLATVTKVWRTASRWQSDINQMQARR